MRTTQRAAAACGALMIVALPAVATRAEARDGGDTLIAPGNVRVEAAGDGRSMRVSWDDNSGGEIGVEVNNGEESRLVPAGRTSYDWATLPLSYMCVHARSSQDGDTSEWIPDTYPWYVCAHTPNSSDAAAFGYSPGDDQRGFYAWQCTAWVASRLTQLNDIDFRNGEYPPQNPVRWGNAYEWKDAAEKTDRRASILPALGSVAWYPLGHPMHPSGHVAYVERVDRDGAILLSEMNYDNAGGFRFQKLRAGDPDWPALFLHVADRRPAGTPG